MVAGHLYPRPLLLCQCRPQDVSQLMSLKCPKYVEALCWRHITGPQGHKPSLGQPQPARSAPRGLEPRGGSTQTPQGSTQKPLALPSCIFSGVCSSPKKPNAQPRNRATASHEFCKSTPTHSLQMSLEREGAMPVRGGTKQTRAKSAEHSKRLAKLERTAANLLFDFFLRRPVRFQPFAVLSTNCVSSSFGRSILSRCRGMRLGKRCHVAVQNAVPRQEHIGWQSVGLP